MKCVIVGAAKEEPTAPCEKVITAFITMDLRISAKHENRIVTFAAFNQRSFSTNCDNEIVVIAAV